MNAVVKIHIILTDKNAPSKLRRMKMVNVRADKVEKDINRLSASLKREFERIEKEA